MTAADRREIGVVEELVTRLLRRGGAGQDQDPGGSMLQTVLDGGGGFT